MVRYIKRNARNCEFFLDTNTGAIGKFVGVVTSHQGLQTAEPGYVHVIYIPPMSLKQQVILNVPVKAILSPIKSIYPNIPGVQKNGYVFLACGERGKRELFDSMEFEVGRNIATIQDILNKSRISNEMKDQQIRRGLDTERELQKKFSEIKSEGNTDRRKRSMLMNEEYV